MSISDLNKDLSPQYMIDFSTPQKYKDSLNNTRSGLGNALPNIKDGDTTVYQLSPRGISGERRGIIIFMRGLEYYGSTDLAPVKFVLDPINLYLAGFICNNNFFRFRDHASLSVEIGEPLTVVNLNQDSSYVTLERIGNISRRDIQINRANLVDGYAQLVQRNSQNMSINESEARGLLRYITVISEALRFRKIQRNFRPALEQNPTAYRLNEDEINLTLNWDGLSSILPFFNAETAPSIRSGVIELHGVQAILLAIGAVLNCSSRKLFIDVDICREDDAIIINKVVWNKQTLLAAL